MGKGSPKMRNYGVRRQAEEVGIGDKERIRVSKYQGSGKDRERI